MGLILLKDHKIIALLLIFWAHTDLTAPTWWAS